MQRKKREQERKYSIKELFETEKDFCTEMTLVHEAFAADTAAPWDFDKAALFGELECVVAFSSNLVHCLEAELAANDDTRVKIALCLTESSEDMKLVYAKYLQSHSNTAALIKTYESMPRFSEYIASRLRLVASVKQRVVISI